MKPWLAKVDLEIAAAATILVAVSLMFFSLAPAPFGFPTIRASAVFLLLASPLVVLSITRWRAVIQDWLAVAPYFRGVTAWLVMLVIGYGAVPMSPATLSSAAFQALIGLACFSICGQQRLSISVKMMIMVFALWGPICLDWYRNAPLLPGISHALDVERLLVFDLTLLLFLVVKPVPDLGYSCRLGRTDLSRAIVAFVVLVIVLVPLGLQLGFIHWHPRHDGLLLLLRRATLIYFFVALPEELIFRGGLQNIIEQHWLGRYRKFGSIVVASIIFGAEHLNTAPKPNWSYMALATLAGVAYGWVWQRTRKLTASAVTHTIVDWAWSTFF